MADKMSRDEQLECRLKLLYFAQSEAAANPEIVYSQGIGSNQKEKINITMLANLVSGYMVPKYEGELKVSRTSAETIADLRSQLRSAVKDAANIARYSKNAELAATYEKFAREGYRFLKMLGTPRANKQIAKVEKHEAKLLDLAAMFAK